MPKMVIYFRRHTTHESTLYITHIIFIFTCTDVFHQYEDISKSQNENIFFDIFPIYKERNMFIEICIISSYSGNLWQFNVRK